MGDQIDLTRIDAVIGWMLVTWAIETLWLVNLPTDTLDIDETLSLQFIDKYSEYV